MLLLVVGTAILFATGVLGGKDKPKVVIAEADEPKKVADLDEQQKKEMEEKTMEEEPIEEEPDGEELMEEESVEEETDGEEPEQDANDVKENLGEIDWRQSYRDAIEDNLAEIGLADSYGFNDINEDGIPEIFTHVASHVDIMLYVKRDGSVGIVSAQKYHGNLLRGDEEVYNSPEEHIYTNMYHYAEDNDTYQPIEEQCIARKWDGNENKYFVDDKEISEQEYTAKQNEIDEIDWKYGDDSAYDSEHYGYGTAGMLLAIEAWGTSSSEDLQEAVDVEAEVAQIREWYYDTQERQDSLICCEYTQGIYYFEYGYAIKGVIPADYDDWGYTREYYYHDHELYFAFLFAGSEEYRLYFKDGKVIRYIDANGTVYDYGDIGEGEQLSERVRLESDALYPDVNCGL